MSKHGLLFIGNGGAAMSAVSAARSAGYAGPIQMVSDTLGEAFNPMLSPYYLAGHMPFERCFPFGREFYKRYDVICRFGSPVESLDPFSREVDLARGVTLPYDRCLVATGARPVVPAVPGIEGSHYVYTLRTAEETIHLHEALAKSKHALVIGASLIGLKMAEVFLSRGTRVTLVDIAEQVLPGAAHPECASIVAEVIRRNGVDLRLQRVLQGVEDGPERASFHFLGGETLQADLCLVSVGIKPRLDFLDASRVEIDNGILVDHMMRTSAEDLFAAGDVSQGTNLLTGQKEVIGLWGNACYQGRTAGYNMAGRKSTFKGGAPDRIGTFFGLHFVHLGEINPAGAETVTVSNRRLAEDGYRLLSFEKGVLKGANLLNDLRNPGKLKTAIRRGFDWGGRLEALGSNVDSTVLAMALGKWFEV